MRLNTAVALVGTLIAISYATTVRLGPRPRERRAAQVLSAVVEAQRAFRDDGGRGRYATALDTLATPCTEAPADDGADAFALDGYVITVRARAGAATGAPDCHGRPTADDFVASAAPRRPGLDGLRALSVSADGRIFAFFDGVPPAERDMAPGGLAMPLDRLTPIP